MITIKVDATGKTKLFNALDSYTRSIARRGISVIVQAHSDKVGTIQVSVTGKNGTAVKTITVVYDTKNDEWIAICDGNEHHLTLLSEITQVIRYKLNNLKVAMNKI